MNSLQVTNKCTNFAKNRTVMLGILQVASYISERFKREFGVRIDEMKLHKLLYFTQRECFIQTFKPMFDTQFEAWKYGPVMVEVRQHYKGDTLRETMTKDEEQSYQLVFDMVFKVYAPQKSWSLSTLSHGEYSWQQARKGYEEQDACEVKMKTEDIMVDADRVRDRRIVLRHLNLS